MCDKVEFVFGYLKIFLIVFQGKISSLDK